MNKANNKRKKNSQEKIQEDNKNLTTKNFKTTAEIQKEIKDKYGI